MDTATADPVAMVDALNPDAIRSRLVELDRQSRALRVLLRAAVARERALDHKPSTADAALRQEVARAS